MGVLGELGLEGVDSRLMLIAPPDSALAEAATLSPRPSIASTLQVSEPAAMVVWWPERRLLQPASLSRLRWMLESGEGEAWLVVDPSDEAMSSAELCSAVQAASLTVLDERPLASGEFGVRVRAG